MSIVTLNNRALKDATAVGTTTGLGNLVFISRSTASSSSSLSITSGINSTYKEYIFVFNNIHLSNDSAFFQFNMSVDTGSNYNVVKTTTYFRAYHAENGSATALEYNTTNDKAQSSDPQPLIVGLSNDNDIGGSGYLHLFEPSSSVFVKHFLSHTSASASAYARQDFVAGYGNNTSAVDAVQFTASAGTIDSGTIDMYGVN